MDTRATDGTWEPLRWLLPPRERQHLSRADIADAGHGYDEFGLNRRAVAAAMALIGPFYDLYFRVRSHGAHHIPASGPAMLAANHSGVLPIDGAMLYLDVLRWTHPPRVPRPIADLFVPRLPLLGTMYSRAGVVSGVRANVKRLLAAGELVMVFPEGTVGIAKPAHERYQLQSWRVGHVELALRERAPIVPVAIVGAEEQWRQIGKLPLHPFGAPFLPLPFPPFPLPVRYDIHYGAPIALHERYAPEDADDPRVLDAAAAEVKEAVRALIAAGVAERKGVFS